MFPQALWASVTAAGFTAALLPEQLILPRIAAGECSFWIGMSEPDSGADLAAARTRAQRVQSGWLVNGTKV